METIQTNARIVEITPEIASELLKRNHSNRRLSNRTVRELASAIKRGEYQLNGEAIKLDTEGNLLDGQHRLTAVVQSDRPIRSYMICGLAHEVFKTIDTGKRRNNADTLSLKLLREAFRADPDGEALCVVGDRTWSVLKREQRDLLRPRVDGVTEKTFYAVEFGTWLHTERIYRGSGGWEGGT